MPSLADELAALGADIHPALEKLAVPVYVIGGDGRLRYMNGAAIERFGDVRGEQFWTVLAPDSVIRAKEALARKLVGTETAAEYPVSVVDKAGSVVPAEISSVALEAEGQVVGVFGLVELHDLPTAVRGPVPELTPRQAEVLRHLAAGCSTAQIAAHLGISRQTVRNHVRDLLARLGVHSRLEAVVHAHALGLVP